MNSIHLYSITQLFKFFHLIWKNTPIIPVGEYLIHRLRRSPFPIGEGKLTCGGAANRGG